MSIRVPNFNAARVLVVGDVMLDRYWTGTAQRISPEAPVPVLKVLDQEDRLGGAANVAANLRQLGVQCGLLGLLGNDEAGKSVEDLLQKLDIKSYCVHDSRIKTITKLRLLSQNQQMLRLDFEELISLKDSDLLEQNFIQALDDYDVVVFSDYAKGSLHKVSLLIERAKDLNKIVLVDPKGLDFSRYANADVITPNQKEFTQVVGEINAELTLEHKARILRQELNVTNLLITRGEHGMYLQTEAHNHQVKTVAKEVHDVTGAGDTVVAVLAASLAVGESINSAMELANIAAGVVVAKVGTSTLTPDELRHALQSQGIGGRKNYTGKELTELIRQLQAQKTKIVMTNGCFDILHAGHIAFLEEAKAQGDYLIVAVNDDASVKRLKGSERPVNHLQDRLAVLAALSSVDWVVAFSDDTPQTLIAELLPDILVKGGDYKIEEIAGGKEVIAAGGEVRVLTYHAGRSTTRIIDQIKSQE